MEEARVQEPERNLVFCDHYKKLIVENFALNEKREDLHYGKCAVIGYCTFDRGVYFLGNVRITSLDPQLQIPDNVHKVLLLTNLCKEAPPVDKFVTVFGESVLFDTMLEFTDDVTSIPCSTAADLYRIRAVHEEINGEVTEDYVSIINTSYRPAIKVHEVIPIEDPHEILNCNLRLNQIIDKF